MKEMITQIIMATIGTVGFAIFFRVKKKHIPYAAAGGLLCWTCYLILYHFSNSTFLSSLFSAFFCSIYSEIFARIRKAPTNVFLLPSLIPLIPGGSLHYTMNYLLANNMQECVKQARITCAFVFGITTGVVVGAFLFRYFSRLCYYFILVHQKKKRNSVKGLRTKR